MSREWERRRRKIPVDSELWKLPFIYPRGWSDGYLWLWWSERMKAKIHTVEERRKKRETSTNKNFPFLVVPPHHLKLELSRLDPILTCCWGWKLCWVDFVAFSCTPNEMKRRKKSRNCVVARALLIFFIKFPLLNVSATMEFFLECSSKFSRISSPTPKTVERSWKEFCWWNLLWLVETQNPF